MLLIGTYTEKVSDQIVGKGQGIYYLNWDCKKGNAELKGHIPAINTSYMAFAPSRQCLYALEELPHSRRPKLKVYKFSHTNNKAAYTLIDQHDINGGSPCHIDIAGNVNELAIACYTTGTAEIYTINGMGKLEHTQSIIHKGKGPNHLRQESAHVHMALYRDKNLHLTDLGTDSVKAYQRKAKNTLNCPQRK